MYAIIKDMGAALLIQKYFNFDYRYGVIAVPELTGWQPLTTADKYLMVATDGIFESLTANDVRDLILEWNSHDNQGSSSSMAEYIVNTAYDKGSTDNLSVILIPL